MQEFAQALPEGMFTSGFVSQLKFAKRFFLAEDAHIHALPALYGGIMFEEQFRRLAAL